MPVEMVNRRIRSDGSQQDAGVWVSVHRFRCTQGVRAP